MSDFDELMGLTHFDLVYKVQTLESALDTMREQLMRHLNANLSKDTERLDFIESEGGQALVLSLLEWTTDGSKRVLRRPLTRDQIDYWIRVYGVQEVDDD